MSLLLVVAVFTVGATAPEAALAQTDTGAIVGTVADVSGGVLPGVSVTATQDETGVVSTTVTNAAGQYVFPSLRVGRYTVAAELQGFKRMLQRDVRPSHMTARRGRLRWRAV